MTMALRNFITTTTALLSVVSHSLATPAPINALSGRDDGATTTLEGDPIPIGELHAGSPRGLLASDGTLFVAYQYNNDPDDPIMKIRVVSSGDEGATWSDPVSVFEVARTDTDLNYPFLFQLSSGELVCALSGHKSNGDGYLDLYKSTDNGATWGMFASMAYAEGQGLWDPFLRYAADGTTLELYYSWDYGGNDQDIARRTSTDGGANWSDAVVVSGASIQVRDGMASVAPLNTDNANDLIMVFESNDNGGDDSNAGHFRIWRQFSHDAGATWEDRGIMFESGDPPNAGGPFVVNFNNILATSLMMYADGVVDKTSVVISSKSGGGGWSAESTKIFDPEAGWGGLVVLSDSVLVLESVNGGITGQKVYFE